MAIVALASMYRLFHVTSQLIDNIERDPALSSRAKIALIVSHVASYVFGLLAIGCLLISSHCPFPPLAKKIVTVVGIGLTACCLITVVGLIAVICIRTFAPRRAT